MRFFSGADDESASVGHSHYTGKQAELSNGAHRGTRRRPGGGLVAGPPAGGRLQVDGLADRPARRGVTRRGAVVCDGRDRQAEAQQASRQSLSSHGRRPAVASRPQFALATPSRARFRSPSRLIQ